MVILLSAPQLTVTASKVPAAFGKWEVFWGQIGDGSRGVSESDDIGVTLHIPFGFGAHWEGRREGTKALHSFVPSQSICDRNRLPIGTKNDTEKLDSVWAGPLISLKKVLKMRFSVHTSAGAYRLEEQILKMYTWKVIEILSLTRMLEICIALCHLKGNAETKVFLFSAFWNGRC